MKLKDFLSTVDCNFYTVYAGALGMGYYCIEPDIDNEIMNYDVANIEILGHASYQVELIPPKKPWVAPGYTIGVLVEISDTSIKGCYNCANKKMRDKCSQCSEYYSNWKNLFIKED